MLVSAFNLYPDKLVGNYGEYFDFEQIVETHQYCNGESTITHRKLIPNLYAIAVDNDLRSNTSITTANIIANILNRIDTNELLYTVTDSWINNDALLDNPLIPDILKAMEECAFTNNFIVYGERMDELYMSAAHRVSDKLIDIAYISTALAMQGLYLNCLSVRFLKHRQCICLTCKNYAYVAL